MSNRKLKPIPNNPKEISQSPISPYLTDQGKPVSETPFDRNRGTDYSMKDDKVKNISIGLEDIDNAVMYYFNNIIKPNVFNNGKQIPVPVIYGSPERWKSVQNDGFYRDNNKRLMVPLIMFKRGNIEKNRTLGNKLDGNKTHLYQIVGTKYNKRNAYDKFDIINNRIPSKQYYISTVPDYVNITYECIIFTDFVEQNNKIIEAVEFASDSYWGDLNRWKFKTRIDSFATTTILENGLDRAAKSTFNIIINGYIIPDTINKDLATVRNKFYTKSQIIFDLEVVDSNGIITNTDELKLSNKKQTNIINSTSFIGGGNNITNVNNIISSAAAGDLTYLNTNITKQANIVIAPDTAIFNNSAILQPSVGSTLPPTTVNNFTFYINGQYVPSSLVTLTESGGNITAVFNIVGLGYSLVSTDEVIAIGNITPLIVRTVLTDMVDSSLFPQDSGSITASYIPTASYALTASYYGGTVISASYALTASYAANTSNVNTSSLVTTSSFNAFTASYNTGSFTGSFIGNLTGTASYATSASYALTAQTLLGSVVSASYASNSTSASHANNADNSISASYASTAQTLLGSVVSASYALSASYATTAQTLLGTVVSASYALTASYVNTSATRSIRTVNNNTSLLSTDYTVLCNTSASNIVVSLDPTLGTYVWNVKKIDSGSNQVIVSMSSGLIDGYAVTQSTLVNDNFSGSLNTNYWLGGLPAGANINTRLVVSGGLSDWSSYIKMTKYHMYDKLQIQVDFKAVTNDATSSWGIQTEGSPNLVLYNSVFYLKVDLSSGSADSGRVLVGFNNTSSFAYSSQAVQFNPNDNLRLTIIKQPFVTQTILENLTTSSNAKAFGEYYINQWGTQGAPKLTFIGGIQEFTNFKITSNVVNHSGSNSGVVFAGDSITAGTGASSIDRRWTNLVQQLQVFQVV
ncbi:unnamed protein product [Wuchereria bancrofti]|uniref:Uncharacterized protein n=1 Tax=Wuchereria bancrofti TaxID=6293 RepID=A0A3P7FN77_WUCBA|nr:unnamed protein product [Wuchereria bancrofti]